MTAINNTVHDTHYGITWLIGISPIRQLTQEELDVVVDYSIKTNKEKLWETWIKSAPNVPVNEQEKKEELFVASLRNSDGKILTVTEEDLRSHVLASRQARSRGSEVPDALK